MLPQNSGAVLDPPATMYVKVIQMFRPATPAARQGYAVVVVGADNSITTRSTRLYPHSSLISVYGGRKTNKSFASTLEAQRHLKSHLNRRHADGYRIADVSTVQRQPGKPYGYDPTDLANLPDYNPQGISGRLCTEAMGVSIDSLWKVRTKGKSSGAPKAKTSAAGGTDVDDRALALIVDFDNGRRDPFSTLGAIRELRSLMGEIETRVTRANELLTTLEVQVMDVYINGTEKPA